MLIQKRFGEVTEEDVREGRFGVSRIVGLAAFHPLVPRPQSMEETKAVDQLEKAGWRTALYVVGVRVARESPAAGRITGPIFPTDAYWPAELDVSVVMAAAQHAINERRAVRGRQEGVLWEAHLVNASSASCVDCHRGKAVGDPLGVVLYAFGPSEGL
jgi:hypothetical protein